ncbi:MAG: HPP family protein [Chloroflexi bacterium]|nr:HPP family protein [Chloroflexota bacterium]
MHPNVHVNVHLVDRRFRHHLRPYLFQSLAAAAILFLVLAIQDVGTHAVIIAAIASTTFILFFMPHRSAARPRKVLGGHGWGLVVGGTIAFIASSAIGQTFGEVAPYAFELEAALAVGLTVLAMVATSTEHAPAPGTALGLVVAPFQWGIMLFVIVSVGLLVLAHSLLRRWLRDLV